MSTTFTEIRGQAMGIQPTTTAPTPAVAGDMYFDTSANRLYIYNGTAWKWATDGTTTSTSTTSTSTSTTTTSSSSTSSTSSSTSSTSSSTSSTSTSTTLF